MKIVKSLSAVALTLSTVAFAQAADVAYNIGVVSLYKSSGVDQDGADKSVQPAIQGGVDLSLDGGLYVGNWNSTGSFGGGDVEIDVYGGYASDLGNGVGYDIGYAYYYYPDTTGWNGGEMYASLSFGGLKAKVTRGVTGSIEDASRASLTYTHAATETTALNITYGKRNVTAGDYSDYAVGVSHDLGSGRALSATYSAASGSDSSRDGRLVVGATQSF
uniref:TorF family putative porin n=1 Tax=Mariniflexile sp. TaxID=1979402 RepID=UPI0040474F72